METFNVFISYARRDGVTLASKLAKSLRETGLKVFWDQDSIPPGANWEKTLDTALDESQHILVILTPMSVISEEVSAEWRPMLQKQKNILPLMYLPCEIPRRLTMRQYIDFQDENQYAFALSELLAAISSFSPGKSPLVLGGEELLQRGTSFLESGQVEAATNDFLDCLKDAKPAIRIQAAHRLRQAKQPETLPRIFQSLSLEKDIEVKATLLRTIVGIVEVVDWGKNTPTWAADVEPYLNDPEPQVRREAIRVLAYGKLMSAAPQIIELLLYDRVPEVRYQAALSLGRLKAPNAVQGLVQALLDQDADTRRIAATALGLCGDPGAISALKGIARTDKVAAVRLAANEAISKIQAGH